jgi:hypothetical protein
MRAAGQNEQQSLFEVVLYFEGNTWLFSTSTQASQLHEALECAEKEFSVHSMHHRLRNTKIAATAAEVIGAADNQSFTKRNGKWQLLTERQTSAEC